MDYLQTKHFAPEDQKLFVNGIEIFGVQNVTAGYTNTLDKLNYVGGFSRNYYQNGPVVASVGVNRVITDKDYLYNISSGSAGVNGMVLRAIGYTGQNFSWVSGYLTDYTVSIRNGAPVIANYDYVVFDDFGALNVTVGSLANDYSNSLLTKKGHYLLGQAAALSGSGNFAFYNTFGNDFFLSGDSYIIDNQLTGQILGLDPGLNTATGTATAQNNISGNIFKKANHFYIPKGNISFNLAHLQLERINSIDISQSIQRLPIYTLNKFTPAHVIVNDVSNVQVSFNGIVNNYQLQSIRSITGLDGAPIQISLKNQFDQTFNQWVYSKMHLVSENVSASNGDVNNVQLVYQGCVNIDNTFGVSYGSGTGIWGPGTGLTGNFNPTGNGALQGLKIWYDAQYLSGVYAADQLVTNFFDRSSNNNHAYYDGTTGDNSPSFGIAENNYSSYIRTGYLESGNYAVRFLSEVGESGTMTSNSLPFFVSGSLFVAYSDDFTDEEVNLIRIGTSGQHIGIKLGHMGPSISTGHYIKFNVGDQVTSLIPSPSGYAEDSFSVASIVFDGATFSGYFYNNYNTTGLAVSSYHSGLLTTGICSITSGLYQLRLGSPIVGSASLGVNVLDVLYYDVPLGQSDRHEVENYLFNKYKLFV